MADYLNAALPVGGVYTSGGFGALAGTGQEALQLDANANLLVVVNKPLPAGTNLLGAINLDLSGTAASVNNGTVDAGTLRVTLASNSTGSLTANIGTTGGLALDATLTGGSQKTKLVDAGGINAASVSAGGALLVTGTGGTFPVTGTFWPATQPVSLASASVASGALSSGSIASGAVAAGAISAGAFVAGSVLSGAFATGALAQLPTTLGQTTKANSLSVTLASDQSPLPVSISATAAGTQVYHSTMVGSTAVAAGGTSTNTYTVTAGKTLSLTQVIASASGKIKVVITAPSNTTPLVATLFNSTATPNAIVDFDAAPIAVAATNTVVVTITNEDNQAQDVYSTIVGIES